MQEQLPRTRSFYIVTEFFLVPRRYVTAIQLNLVGALTLQSLPKDLVKNNLPKSLFLVVKPFVLSLSKHERLDAVGPKFFRPPFDKAFSPERSRRVRANGKISPIHIGKLLPAIS
ncbi:MAG: hypothetical protein WAW41_19360 [Methylobacter sp.]